VVREETRGQDHRPGGARQGATRPDLPRGDAARAITLDGGTSTLRARLVNLATGTIETTARREVGAADTARGGSASALRGAVRDVIAEVDPAARAIGVVGSGMLTSELGIEAVAHVAAPAGLEELFAARRVREWTERGVRPLVLVPGVRTPAAHWSNGDLMRGEECETLGAWQALGRPPGPRLFLWPGSHTKLVGLDALGRVAWSHTTLAGEIWSAVARGTILAGSLDEPPPSDAWNEAALEAGADLAERRGLGRAAFAVRLAAQGRALDAAGLWSFWLGAVVGDDVASLTRPPSLLGAAGTIHVGGRQPQRGCYARRLERVVPGRVEILDDRISDAAAAWGALLAAGWLEPSVLVNSR
jgi:2-dehydro-3-deoxygalactonokinase